MNKEQRIKELQDKLEQVKQELETLKNEPQYESFEGFDANGWMCQSGSHKGLYLSATFKWEIVTDRYGDSILRAIKKP